MYKVIKDFKDLRDSGYEYHVGDVYPRDGVEAVPKRIIQLSTPTSERGALIAKDEAADKKKKG